jgi:chromodomain-helicase-DNA-binding protein 4
MLEALKHSTEPDHLVAEAKKYLRGLKGSLVQLKKQKEAKSHAAREAIFEQQYARARGPVW